MKIFIKKLEVINWNDIAKCSMEFDRYERNFVQVVHKNSLICSAIQACLGSDEELRASISPNITVKLDILFSESMEQQYIDTETVRRYTKVKGISTAFITTVKRSGNVFFLQNLVKVIFVILNI